MAGINSITISGRLGSDPEMRYTQAGKAVASFRVACNRAQKDECDWFSVTCWEKQAEFASNYLRKGREVTIQGRMQSRQYERDGQKVTTWEIVARDVDPHGPREDTGSQPAPAQHPQRQTQQRPVSHATQQTINQAWAAHGPEMPDDEVLF